NKQQSSTPLTTGFRAFIYYVSEGSAPPEGWALTNTASAVIEYPGSGLAPYDAGSATASLLITPRPANFTVNGTRTLPVTGNPVPGDPVEFRLFGTTTAMEPSAAIEPQYVFVAPYQWDIVPSSWSV